MGTNESWLSIRGGARADVVSAIIASYTARGAKLRSRVRDSSLERGHPAKKASPLALAVTTPKKGWIQVVDSFGYTSDLALARDLAGALETTVFRQSVTDVAGHEATERFGPSLPPTALPGMPARAYHCRRSRELAPLRRATSPHRSLDMAKPEALACASSANVKKCFGSEFPLTTLRAF